MIHFPFDPSNGPSAANAEGKTLQTPVEAVGSLSKTPDAVLLELSHLAAANSRLAETFLAQLGVFLQVQNSASSSLNPSDAVRLLERAADLIQSSNRSVETMSSALSTFSVPLSSGQGVLGPTTMAKTHPAEKLLKTAVEEYIEEKKLGSWRKGTDRDIAPLILELAEFLPDRPLRIISREDLRAYRNAVARLPKNRTKSKLWRGLSLRDLQYKRIPETERISTVTLKNRLDKTRSFLQWCRRAYGPDVLEKGIEEALEMQLRPDERKTPVQGFSEEELRKIFTSPSFNSVDPSASWKFWLPALALCSGARLEELCRLTVRDVVSVDGIPCIRILETRDHSLKTKAANRTIPLHPILLDLDFPGYVHRLSGGPEAFLFPSLTEYDGKRGYGPSKWFGEALRSIGVADADRPRQKVFHSLRHTFAQMAREAGIGDPALKQILGHKDSSTVGSHYAQALPLKELFEEIQKLPFDKMLSGFSTEEKLDHSPVKPPSLYEPSSLAA